MLVRQIYIVDEDPAAALITQRGLQTMLGERFSIMVASSPNAAWLACATGHVDLVIVDPNPHGNAAISLVRAVQAFRPMIPVLVLTAYDSPGLRMKMRGLGVTRYVAKPIELRELVPIVHTILQSERSMKPAVGPSLAALSVSGSSGK
ncbi:response regulator transcription factor [Candidatus Viridilinea mediisalina]|uniref:Response regulator n=1 Tax=Candidatus Viridilinea mediisalina TaxID=2024553 RepID=A0A2A6RG44_9CHLR|nr:response regulator [Candidatus Viridilinea mediisalina]PDW01845.1 response regulator [Candidatus Viridilinea mediisalina]